MRRRHCLALPWMLAGAAVAAAPRPPSALPSVQVLPPLHLPSLGRSRTLRLCLPPSYGQGERRYPVVYLHDAQNLFDDATSYIGEWGIDEAMPALAAEAGIEALIVGIDHGGDHRITELNPWDHPRFGRGEGVAYLRDLVEVIKPAIDAAYRTRPAREHTAVMGSSMGGLISHAALLRHPDVFSRAGVLSPAYGVAPAIFDPALHRALPGDARICLSMGSEEGAQALDAVRRMHSLLQASMGPRVTLHEVAGAKHDEAAWRIQFPRTMRCLFAAA